MKAFNIEELRKQAKRRLPRAVFDFIDGGAEDESTLRGNRAAFGKVRLLRRVLVGVSEVNTETTILGKTAKFPIAIAPTGAVGFGWRGGDIAVAKAAADFGIPFRFTPRNVLDFATRPAWALDMLLRGAPQLENLTGMTVADQKRTRNIVSSVGRDQDPSLDWEVIKRVRDVWPGKLLIKGVVLPADAERAVSVGCDGVIVSNHGGRQLDTELASFDALPGVARAIGGKASVLLDGGIRRGSDIFKALARGAEAVMIGRATYYGVCADGEAGARRALEILSDELVRTMQLCGTRSIAEIGPELLAA